MKNVAKVERKVPTNFFLQGRPRHGNSCKQQLFAEKIFEKIVDIYYSTTNLWKVLPISD